MSSKLNMIIFPSRGSEMMVKLRIIAATKGHGLLKKKADALIFRFRLIHSKIMQCKTMMSESLREAAFSLAEVKFVTGDYINQVILQNVDKAQTKVTSKRDNVAGTILIIYESYQDGPDTYEYAGLARGGQQLAICKENYQKVIALLIELASLQTSFLLLDEVIKVTTRRVNAIEHIIIPGLSGALAYITAELDERDREEFFRIKKIQMKKKSIRDAKDKADEIPTPTAMICKCVNMLDNEDKDLLF